MDLARSFSFCVPKGFVGHESSQFSLIFVHLTYTKYMQDDFSDLRSVITEIFLFDSSLSLSHMYNNTVLKPSLFSTYQM